jgi:ABC-type multidrug transport system fused ATPase/permease subunit
LVVHLPQQKQNRARVLRRHQDRLDAWLAHLAQIDTRFTWIRLGVVAAGFALFLLALGLGSLSWRWAVVLLTLAVFSFVVYLHRRLDRARQRARLRKLWTAVQLARLELDWERLPQALAEDLPGLADHPFAIDLDLLGERSLHRLIDTAVSLGGSRRLREWLLETRPEASSTLKRQRLVRALQPHAGFRGQLALHGALAAGAQAGKPGRLAPVRWDGERLLAWSQGQPEATKSLAPVLALLFGLAFLNLVLFVLNLLGALPPYWGISLLAYFAVYGTRFSAARQLFDEAYELRLILTRLQAVLLFLEGYHFPPASELAALLAPFQCKPGCPSRLLRSVEWVLGAGGLQNNPIAWFFFNLVVPWDLFFAARLQGLKARVRVQLPAWLESWYELEALNSLANYAYLNPEFGFPELLEPGGEDLPVFRAQGLGHPLIPAAQRVVNDFSLARLGEMVIVSGSNMSGKSTFLRTLGVNLCLAYAGGPAVAESLAVIPLRLFTCIHISDSLSDGISYFYAEVRRLKALLDALQDEHSLPLFYLIDEIFRGTNNRERQIGSQAYVRALAGAQGVGVISTHDLELVRLADDHAQVRNLHFREQIQDGRMVFDYRLRPGPCPTTNALKIMQAAGLPVPAAQDQPAAQE